MEVVAREGSGAVQAQYLRGRWIHRAVVERVAQVARGTGLECCPGACHEVGEPIRGAWRVG